MKLNFYSKIIILLITMIPHCFAATEAELAKQSASVEAGLLFIKNEDEARCEEYNNTPGEFARYKEHTNKIDDLLSNENKVKQDETASAEMINVIVIAAIDKGITHYNDGSITGLSPVKKTLASLTTGHALINHFTVLSLIEDAAVSFVKGNKNIFNSACFEDIANNANSIFADILKLNSSITKAVFTNCLTISYGKHGAGINVVGKAIEQIKIEEHKRAEAEVIKAALEAKEVEKAKEIEDAEIARKAKELEDAEIARKAKELEDAEIARKAKELEDAEIARKAKELEDAEIARKAEDAEIARKAKELEDARIAAEQAEKDRPIAEKGGKGKGEKGKGGKGKGGKGKK